MGVMMSSTVGDTPPLADSADRGTITAPRLAARVAQVFIAAQTAVQLVIGAAGGSQMPGFQVAVQILLWTVTGSVVSFLVWFRRCRRNAELFAPGTQKHPSGFAVGGWFIPVAMWWIPRRVTADIWRASGVTGTAWLVDVWWAAWLLKSVGAGIVTQAGGPSVYVTAAVVALPAGVLAVALIERITTAQAARLSV
ncbi:DUF4328 domain-containing protein [Streptomyces sp. YIM S03343]